MSRGAQQRILSQLAASPNELASGMAQCIEALRLISALPRAYPLLVEYAGNPKSLMIKAFGRAQLSRLPLRAVAALVKTSMGLPDNVRVTSATFYREDGSIDPSRILLDEDSWKELVPYVHMLHIEDDRPASNAPAASSLSTTGKPGLNTGANAFVPSSSSISIRTLEGTQVSLQNLRNLYSPNSPPPSSPFALLDNNSV